MSNEQYLFSIVIPHYNETERDLMPLLSSINNQLGIDKSQIEVVIVNDAGYKLDMEFLKLFDMKIVLINQSENKGPGVTRQVGLQNARGKYVMFCDADDVLQNVGVLGLFNAEFKKTGADYLSSSWLEERKINGMLVYSNHNIENTWMHGKCFERAFLMDNNIRFDDTLRVHEDTYFLSIARAMAKNARYIPVTTYVWRWHDESITRRNDGIYHYKEYPEFIQACLKANDEIQERLGDEALAYKIVQFIIYNYFIFLDERWHEEDKEQYYQASINVFKSRMKPYWYIWDNADDQFISYVYSEERNKNYLGIEPFNIHNWVKEIRGIE